MTSFLQRLAKEIAIHHGTDPGQLCVVLPNRRAGLYLKRYLAAELNKTSWSPQTFSVEDFITEISGFRIIDPAGLLFECYHVHKNIHGDKSQDFDVFADWAPTLLKDFEEIDQYLVDPDKIFNFLNAARALTVWNLDGQPLTEHELNYIGFYNSFLEYYQQLTKKLLGKKVVYQGLAYRYAAENITSLASHFTWKKIYFAGLNALSLAEEKVIEQLLRNEQAEVFWDADEYYIKDERQEAGDFIREYLKKWPGDQSRWIENDFRSIHKKIQVYGIPRSMGQAMKAGQIINRIKSQEKAPDKTALVLADEKLLLPVLYSLPLDIGPVNVTMGYPLKYTHAYQLVSLLFQMQENAEKFASQRKNNTKSFYVKDILKILAHPYLLLFGPAISSEQVSFEKISESIKKRNRVFMLPHEIEQLSKDTPEEFKKLVIRLFILWESPLTALDSLIKLFELFRDRIIEGRQVESPDRHVDLEYLFHLSKVIKRTRTMMETYPYIKNLKALRKILFQVLDSSRLPFTGEPLQGLQVMGVLETRAVDFENLVVLSVNDGILPSGRLPNSFIPFDIKKEFGLPTYQHKDAVFAYHFYRMLQRARNIYLLYDTEGDMMKGGEKSRFIMQIAYELPKYNPGTEITEQLLGSDPPETGSEKPIVVIKTPEVMARLKVKSEKGFSPSTLNLYIKCPLQFYFQEILGLSESETIEETIESKTMGTVIHEVLQKVYEPFTGKFVDPAILTGKLAETKKYLLEAFSEHYKEGELDFGKNHLIFKVSHFLINEFIQHEAGFLTNAVHPASTLKISSLERLLKSSVSCMMSGSKMDIRLKGKTDRIDELGDKVRIIDYKTGSVQASELKVKSWDTLTSDPAMAKAFQLLMYAWLYFKNQESHDLEILSGNISLRKISDGFIPVKLPDNASIDQESMQIFEESLKGLLEQILDPDIAFLQTENVEICLYCPFKSICTR